MRSLNALIALSATRLLDRPPGSPEGVAEETAAKDAGNGALGLVHRQVKSAIEVTQQGHHPFTRPPRSHIDVAVVGIAAERMAPPFKFLVHLIQQHIGQKRRQRPTLWRASGPLDDRPSTMSAFR